MTEQEQNEAICEWLGWKSGRINRAPGVLCGVLWDRNDGSGFSHCTPTFRTGNDAQLMLQKLRTVVSVYIILDLHFAEVRLNDKRHVEFELPDAVRAAVLSIIEEKS